MVDEGDLPAVRALRLEGFASSTVPALQLDYRSLIHEKSSGAGGDPKV